MAATHMQEELLNEFYAPPEQEGSDLEEKFLDHFILARISFQEWKEVWRMDVDPDNKYKENVEGFSVNIMKEEAFDAIEEGILKFGSIKASFGMEHYYYYNTETLFQRRNRPFYSRKL